MPNGPTLKIFLRPTFLKRDGSTPVYISKIINRKKKDYAVGVSIFEPDKFWDLKTRRVKRCSWINQNYVNGVIEDAETRTPAAALRASGLLCLGYIISFRFKNS